MAEPIEMPFGMWTWVGPRNYLLDGGPYPHTRSPFDGVTSGFSHMPPSTVSSIFGVGISPHAADQCSNWPAVEVLECHTKFSQWEIFHLQCNSQFIFLLTQWQISSEIMSGISRRGKTSVNATNTVLFYQMLARLWQSWILYPSHNFLWNVLSYCSYVAEVIYILDSWS